MSRSARPLLVFGMILLVVTAIGIVPTRPHGPSTPIAAVRYAPAVHWTQLSPQPAGPVARRTASETLLAPSVESAADVPDLLVGWLARIVVPPSVGASFPEPEFPPVVVGNSIDSAIKNVYNAIEPWVEWGFDVAAYAVGWIPYVGWLAPQIEIFYNFGERIVRSITFNIADWLGGNISFWDGLVNVVVDTINSFIFLANDQLAFWLPPLPPIPPIGPFATDIEARDIETTDIESTDIEGTYDTQDFEKSVHAGTSGLMLMSSSLDGSTQPIEPETEGEPADENLGEMLTQSDELPLEQELTQGQGVQVVDGSIGQTEPGLQADGLAVRDELKGDDDRATTDKSGTVQAQGEIRRSSVATPNDLSPHQQNTNPSPADNAGAPPADPVQPPSPQTPSTDDDSAQNTADPNPGQGAGTTAGTD